MSEENKNPEAENGRRRLLKALGIAGVGAAVLPTRWFQPIVDAIISPSHAAGLSCTSGQSQCQQLPCTPTPFVTGGYLNANATTCLIRK